MQLSQFIKHSTVKISVFSLVSLGSMTMANSAQAIGLIDFSSPDWEKFGDVTTPSQGSANMSNAFLGTEFIISDDEDGSEAFNYSGQRPIEALFPTDLQTSLGLPDTALDVDDDNLAWEGSAIRGSVTVGAGDVLRFNWNFRTNESQSRGGMDFAFFLVGNQVIKLADFTDATKASDPFFRETGFREYTFAQAGTYTIAFGVVDIGDYLVSSALEIKDARIEPVPEPLTILGVMTGVTFGTVMRRKFGAPKKKIH
jgi:hypothetical protein